MFPSALASYLPYLTDRIIKHTEGTQITFRRSSSGQLQQISHQLKRCKCLLSVQSTNTSYVFREFFPVDRIVKINPLRLYADCFDAKREKRKKDETRVCHRAAGSPSGPRPDRPRVEPDLGCTDWPRLPQDRWIKTWPCGRSNFKR